ncbi:hypothetical protein [Halorussus salinus]|uniref:hypothetical protein n=1 Tax=Halorussus salinus TaxID=1364935 RepID=UPI0010919E07|nr:hypothetical protein [Halorussus salinus]
MFELLRESGETVLGGAIAGVVATAITQSSSEISATFLAITGVAMLVFYKGWMKILDSRYSEENSKRENKIVENERRKADKNWKYT